MEIYVIDDGVLEFVGSFDFGNFARAEQKEWNGESE